jgi:hypothetical protein
MPKRWRMPPETRQLLFARVQRWFVEGGVNHLVTHLLVGDAFVDGEVVEALLCGDVRLNAEFLRETAELF